MLRESKEKTIQRIQKEFPSIIAPFPAWEGCNNVEDFVRKFGEEFLKEFWRQMHDRPKDTRFMFPFVLQYFLTADTADGFSNEADLFIGTLDPVVQKEVQYDYYVEQFHDSLTPSQRQVVCEWLRVMEKRDRLLFNVRGAKEYWCGK